MSTPDASRRVRVAAVCLLLGGVAIGAALVEGVLRVYAAVATTELAVALQIDPYDVLVEPHGTAGYRPRAGSVFTYDNGTRATTNASGFRGPVVDVPKPEGTFRIVLFGGSTTFGWGVDDDETIAAHMRTLFAERHPGLPIEVVNLGFDGYDSYQLAERLASDGVRLEPDVIIVNTGVNDVRNAWYRDLEPADARTLLYRATLEQLRREDARGGPTVWTRLKHYFYLARVPGWLRGELSGAGSAGTDAHAVGGAEVHWDALTYFERNLRRIIEAGSEAGAVVLLSTPPSSLRTRYEPDDPPIRSYWLQNAEQTQVYRDSLNVRLRQMAEYAGSVDGRSKYVPLEGVPPEDFLDDAHLTSTGNRRVAEAFVHAVEPVLETWRR